MMKPLTFKEWLKDRGLCEVDLKVADTFATGQKKPSPELNRIANTMLTKGGPAFFNSINTAPSTNMAQNRLMGASQTAFKGLNPNAQKQFPVGDIANAAASSMGFKNLMKNPLS